MSHTSNSVGNSSIRILLIRHSESTANESGILSTTQPGPDLTARGREQAEALADALRDVPLDGLYASTLRRTQLTAEPLSRVTGLPITVIEGIHEIEAGDLEDRADLEAMSAYAQPFTVWAQGDFTAAVPGGFSGDHFFERFDRGIAEIWQAHQTPSSDRPDGDTVAIVDHDAAIRVWVAGRADNLGPDFTSTHGLDNTGIVVLTGSPAAGWHVETWQGEPVA
ncbi:histidine phosphatase family protein [Agreia sp. VKM Ac-1783]|uniref:histidine phosphatase family protein n=1 Tax=Agreia sp. VKM Ac-1783 TaxID=1938889 RepID=UPI000A2ACBDA|nr:histidine phosphatase family protein [Agreia sp. VKM Ac-1783]SMQ71192.1 probable phosphoglycerate mutase [Agreia sp. VKM Ac-1783]